MSHIQRNYGRIASDNASSKIASTQCCVISSGMKISKAKLSQVNKCLEVRGGEGKGEKEKKERD